MWYILNVYVRGEREREGEDRKRFKFDKERKWERVNTTKDKERRQAIKEQTNKRRRNRLAA